MRFDNQKFEMQIKSNRHRKKFKHFGTAFCSSSLNHILANSVRSLWHYIWHIICGIIYRTLTACSLSTLAMVCLIYYIYYLWHNISHAHCLQFEHSGNGLMSHIRETSMVTINTSYFHPAHQHYTDEAQKCRNGTVCS